MSEVHSSPASAALLDNDDMLCEIFLRLSPLPSSLLRASLVCKRWRRLLTDPGFLRSFRAYHRTPPLLGFFYGCFTEPVFVPMLDPPDRIPHARFSLPQRNGQNWKFLGCRHGLAAFLDLYRRVVIVWEPVTSRQWCIAFPSGMKIGGQSSILSGAVLNGSNGHMHNDGSFQFVLISTNGVDKLVCACLYESESGKWGNISSIEVSSRPFLFYPSVLVGNALCWYLHRGGDVLEFDLDRQSLGVIQKPEAAVFMANSSFWVLRTQNGRLGLAIVSALSIQLWGRKADSNGASKWELDKTVQLDKLLSLKLSTEKWRTKIQGFDEDSNVIFLSTVNAVFTIHLESMQFKKLLEEEDSWTICDIYPYRSFYTSVGNGDDGAKILNKTRDDYPV